MTQAWIMTPEKEKEAHQLRAEGWSWRRIAKHFHTNSNTLMCKLYPERMERRRIKDRARKRFVRENGWDNVGHSVLRLDRCPDDVLAERDRRMNLELTLSQYYFGDPPPGRSALDKKQQRTFNV